MEALLQIEGKEMWPGIFALGMLSTMLLIAGMKAAKEWWYAYRERHNTRIVNERMRRYCGKADA